MVSTVKLLASTAACADAARHADEQIQEKPPLSLQRSQSTASAVVTRECTIGVGEGGT